MTVLTYDVEVYSNTSVGLLYLPSWLDHGRATCVSMHLGSTRSCSGLLDMLSSLSFLLSGSCVGQCSDKPPNRIFDASLLAVQFGIIPDNQVIYARFHAAGSRTVYDGFDGFAVSYPCNSTICDGPRDFKIVRDACDIKESLTNRICQSELRYMVHRSCSAERPCPAVVIIQAGQRIN